MLDTLKDKLVCELKDVSKDGVKTGNIEYICKLAETYKNLNKAEKEELESMLYDERLNYRPDLNRRYDNDYYGAPYNDMRGRGSHARRDSMGRYAYPINPIEDFYGEYMGAKRRYRAGGAEPREMFEGLEMMMKHITMLVEDLYKESDSEEERRIMDKYIKRIADIR